MKYKDMKMDANADITSTLEVIRSELKRQGLESVVGNKLSHSYYDCAMKLLLESVVAKLSGEYAFYVSGSWGEERLSRSSDQDHFIFTTEAMSVEQQRTFQSDMLRVQQIMELLGLRQCPGNIQASSPAYIFSAKNFQPPRGVRNIDRVDALVRGRLLVGNVDLRPKSLSVYYQSAEFRRTCLTHLLMRCLYLTVAFDRSTRAQLLREVLIDDCTIKRSAQFHELPMYPVKIEASHGGALKKAYACFKGLWADYDRLFSSDL